MRDACTHGQIHNRKAILREGGANGSGDVRKAVPVIYASFISLGHNSSNSPGSLHRQAVHHHSATAFCRIDIVAVQCQLSLIDRHHIFLWAWIFICNDEFYSDRYCGSCCSLILGPPGMMCGVRGAKKAPSPARTRDSQSICKPFSPMERYRSRRFVRCSSAVRYVR